ncbi:hypothetical protein J4221_06405 [Candidatus Pacearchaeota archaeon]|nr:hypothetical protein [Candidatus Pacearchaeota archaeon]
MGFKDKSITIKGGIIGAIILPLLYIILLLITQDPDFIIFTLGPFGIIVWLVQWISFLIGGWILAIIATILFFILIGFPLGLLIGLIVKKIVAKKQ